VKQSALILFVLLIAILAGLAGCSGQPSPAIALEPSVTPSPTAIPPTATETPVPTVTPRPTDIGATPYPSGYDPLTGLTVDDPSVLDRRPLVTKVSNESPEVRPQSGLSFADNVWEYQMEGFQQTRFTAIFYSQMPERVGSVRSARLIDVEELVYMYDGLLVYSGCSIGVCYRIKTAPWGNQRAFREDDVALLRIPDVPRPGTNRYHTLFALPEKIWQEADERKVNGRPNLRPLLFSPHTPADGIATTDFVIDYPDLGSRHRWHYDATSNKWLSFVLDQRFQAPEIADVDSLTEKQLAFDNVVLVYADHRLADFIEDEPNQLASVGIKLTGEGDAVIMRDGKRFPCRWVREQPSDMIRFVDKNGNPIPLKPGTTWFNVYSDNMFQPTVSFSQDH
jgi:DUF3048 family protein